MRKIGRGAPRTRNVVDLSTLTCEEALAEAKRDTAAFGWILFWTTGYFSHYANSTIHDTAKSLSVDRQIGDFCRANPQIGFFTAVKKFRGT
jgi:hypothetical protein